MADIPDGRVAVSTGQVVSAVTKPQVVHNITKQANTTISNLTYKLVQPNKLKTKHN